MYEEYLVGVCSHIVGVSIVKVNNNQEVFLFLLRAGMFPVHDQGGANGLLFEGVDWGEVYRLAEEQSVIGLVAAGLDWFKVQDSRFKVPQEWALQFVGQTLQIEQRNKAMNVFVAQLIDKLRANDIYALLVKGQGIAQCYEKPLWRSSGDVDLLLSDNNYEKAKTLLVPLATSVEDENTYTRHLGMIIDGWEVELHGNLRSELSNRIDCGIDEITGDVFYGGNVRSWMNGKTQVFLMGANNDVFYVFTHILQHFFRGGIGLRQVCDWCRLLWTFRDTLNIRLLEKRLRQAGIISEWRALADLAVTFLGMPTDAMPLYHSTSISQWRAKRILERIIETGNFGQNRDSCHLNKSFLQRKATSLWHYTLDALSTLIIFPLDSIRGLHTLAVAGLKRSIGI